MLRLTWVQPEDLIGHELRQAAQDGREPSRIAARWRAAGGSQAPRCAGASPDRASRYLRLLAEDLLDELADLPSKLADDEPTDLSAIKAGCPAWPARPGGTPSAPGPRAHPRRPPPPPGSRLARQSRRLPPGQTGGETPPHRHPPTRPGHRQLAPEHLVHRQRSPRGTDEGTPWNRRSAATSLAENIDGMPEDDDLNYPLLNLLLLQRHGPRFTTADVARLWLDELPAGRTFTAERVAYRNLLSGLEPPLTARHRNPFREWIGALIRADVHGWTNPGAPATAAEQAYRDATLTHTANGVYAAMFTAATIAEAATGTHDIHACLRTGLTVVPPRSRLARAIHHGIQLAEAHHDFTTVVDELHATHAATHHWVHAIPNTALIAAALTHADGDFTGSVCRAVSGGWDTDSNGATAGSIAGLLAGSPAALGDRWTSPLKNRLATSVADFKGTGFDTLAQLTHSLTHLETAHP